MEFNGATFNKAQQDQLKRALENGGTTLNKYTVTLGNTSENILTLVRILNNAKSIISLAGKRLSAWFPLQFPAIANSNYLPLYGINVQSSGATLFGTTIDTNAGTQSDYISFNVKESGVTFTDTVPLSGFKVEYYNDTEII